MLGGGIALTVLGYGAAQADAINGFWGGDTKKDNSGAVMIVAGMVSTLGSIPMFIMASNHKRKAADLAFSVQRIPMQSIAKNQVYQPALTLKVPL